MLRIAQGVDVGMKGVGLEQLERILQELLVASLQDPGVEQAILGVVQAPGRMEPQRKGLEEGGDGEHGQGRDLQPELRRTAQHRSIII